MDGRVTRVPDDERAATVARRTLLGTVGLAGLGGLIAACLGATGRGAPAPAPAAAAGPTAAHTAAGHTSAAGYVTAAPVTAMPDHAAAAAAVVKRFVSGEWEKVVP